MDTQLLVNLLDLIVVVVSVIVLFRQTGLMVKQTRASVYQSIAGQMIEIDRVFLEHPSLKPYFYEGKPLPPVGTSDYYQVMSIAEMLIDFIDSVMTQAPNMPDYPWSTWQAYFTDLLQASPALQFYWQRYRKWYPQAIRILLDPVMERVQQGKETRIVTTYPQFQNRVN